MVSEDAGEGYPGQQLGRPETGPGSVAQPGRRLFSLLIDWLICLLISVGFGRALGLQAASQFYPLLVLLVMNVMLIPTAGATIGQRLVGLRTEGVHGGPMTFAAVAIRSVLLVLVLPAVTLIWQRDLRGAHDMAAGAVVTRTG